MEGESSDDPRQQDRSMDVAGATNDRNNECIICYSPCFEASSACCQQPIHYRCIDVWFQNELQSKSFVDITCPFCRTKVNSFDFDLMVLRYKERMEQRPYNEDRVFMRAVKSAWGNRPFWIENDGNFYGEMLNGKTGRHDVVYLGSNKEQTLFRMRAITNYFVEPVDNIWSHLCNSRYVSK